MMRQKRSIQKKKNGGKKVKKNIKAWKREMAIDTKEKEKKRSHRGKVFKVLF